MQLKRKKDKRLIKTTKMRLLKEEAGYCAVFFTANTSYGTAGIRACMGGVAKSSVKTSDALCALVMGVVEEKIQFVENWLRCVIDVAPGSEAPDQHAQLFTLKDKNGEGSSISVFLPFRYWRLIPAFDALSLPEHWEICWHSYRGSLNLSRLVLSRADLSSIAPGSVVLLPESFTSPWSVSLSVPALDVGMSGEFNEQQSLWSGDGQIIGLDAAESLLDAEESVAGRGQASAHTASSSDQSASVSCAMTLSARDLLNSADSGPVMQLPPESKAQVLLRVPDGRVFRGAIAPLANGYALYVDADNT